MNKDSHVTRKASQGKVVKRPWIKIKILFFCNHRRAISKKKYINKVMHGGIISLVKKHCTAKKLRTEILPT